MNNSYMQAKRVPLKNCAVAASVYSPKSVSSLVTQVLWVSNTVPHALLSFTVMVTL
jgi:hypothetical protein